jgi:hypothetical protein
MCITPTEKIFHSPAARGKKVASLDRFFPRFSFTYILRQDILINYIRTDKRDQG